jgi:hypothetical protein
MSFIKLNIKTVRYTARLPQAGVLLSFIKRVFYTLFSNLLIYVGYSLRKQDL